MALLRDVHFSMFRKAKLGPQTEAKLKCECPPVIAVKDATGNGVIQPLSGPPKTHTVSFARGTGCANDTLTTQSGDFGADGFKKGDQFVLIGAGNDGIYTILNDEDDGTEVDGSLWLHDGLEGLNRNQLGATAGSLCLLMPRQ